LLHPWHNIKDIKYLNEIFESAFNLFVTTTSPSDIDVITGIHYYYKCKNAADKHHSDDVSLLQGTDERQKVDKFMDVGMDVDEADENENVNIQLTKDNL